MKDMQVVAGKGDHLLEGHLLLLGEGRLREIEKWKNNSNFYTYQADAAGEVAQIPHGLVCVPFPQVAGIIIIRLLKSQYLITGWPRYPVWWLPTL